MVSLIVSTFPITRLKPGVNDNNFPFCAKRDEDLDQHAVIRLRGLLSNVSCRLPTALVDQFR